MLTEKLLGLLTALARGTSRGMIQWQELQDSEMFRANVHPGMVRIGKSGDETGKQGYILWVIAASGVIVGEIEIFEDEPQFTIMEELYKTARLKARGGDFLIDQMMQSLPSS